MSFLMLFLLVAAFLLVAVAAMAIGVMFGRRPISGSCGGLGNQPEGSSCSMCANRDSCTEATRTSQSSTVDSQ